MNLFSLEQELNSLVNYNYSIFSFNLLQEEINNLIKFAADNVKLQEAAKKIQGKLILIKELNQQLDKYPLNVDFPDLVKNVILTINQDSMLNTSQKESLISRFTSSNALTYWGYLKKIKEATDNITSISTETPDQLFSLSIPLMEINNLFNKDIISFGSNTYNYGQNYKLIGNIFYIYDNKDRIDNITEFLANEINYVNDFIRVIFGLVKESYDLLLYINSILNNNVFNKIINTTPEGYNEQYLRRRVFQQSGGRGLEARDIGDVNIISNIAKIRDFYPKTRGLDPSLDPVTEFNSIVNYKDKIIDKIKFYFDVYLKLISYAQTIGNQELEVAIKNFPTSQGKYHDFSIKIIEKNKDMLAKVLDLIIGKNISLEMIPSVFSRCSFDENGVLRVRTDPQLFDNSAQTYGVLRGYNSHLRDEFTAPQIEVSQLPERATSARTRGVDPMLDLTKASKVYKEEWKSLLTTIMDEEKAKIAAVLSEDYGYKVNRGIKNKYIREITLRDDQIAKKFEEAGIVYKDKPLSRRTITELRILMGYPGYAERLSTYISKI